MGNYEIHVTAIRNGDVFGHETTHCDIAGCACADEMFWDVDPDEVERGHVYEIDAEGHVIAELVETGEAPARYEPTPEHQWAWRQLDLETVLGTELADRCQIDPDGLTCSEDDHAAVVEAVEAAITTADPTDPEPTIAARLAARCGNDGLSFRTARGVSVTELFDRCAKRSRVHFEKTRYEFRDGSAISVQGDAWDLQHPECTCGWCWDELRCQPDQPEYRCQCGLDCGWRGPAEEMVLVERMPDHLRASHRAAGNVGAYPGNGAERLLVSVTCAEELCDADEDWTWVVADSVDDNIARDYAEPIERARHEHVAYQEAIAEREESR